MSIAFDAGSSSSFIDATSTPCTLAHTCSGTNRVLVVGVSNVNTEGRIAGASPPTYSGVTMTEALADNISAGTGWTQGKVWVLVNPPAGTANVVFSGTAAGHYNIHAVSFTGVDQTTPVDTTADYAVMYPSSPVSTAISLAVGSMAVDFVHDRLGSLTLTPSAEQIRAGSQVGTSVSTSSASYKSGATAMGWTISPSGGLEALRHMIIGLKAAAETGATATLSTTLDPAVFSGIASVSPLTVLTATMADAVFSGSAGTSGIASLSVSTDAAVFSGAASVAGSGTITLLLTNNTGTLLASETGATVYAYATSGDHVVTKTGQTTNGSGVMTITDPLIVAATQYRVVVVLASGDEGLDKATAV